MKSLVQAGLAGVLGLAGSSNVQGEDQKKLDILSNEVFKNVLKKSGQCCVLVGAGGTAPPLRRAVPVHAHELAVVVGGEEMWRWAVG